MPLLAELRRGELELSHEALDSHPSRQAARRLEDLLVAAGALPSRDPALARMEEWIEQHLAGGDHESVLRPFAHWIVLRRYRRKSQTAPLNYGELARAKAELVSGTAFLGWLADRSRPLGECAQADIDAWLAGPRADRHIARPFTRWAMAQKLMPRLDFPAGHRSGPSPPITHHDRVTLTRRLLEDPEIAAPRAGRRDRRRDLRAADRARRAHNDRSDHAQRHRDHDPIRRDHGHAARARRRRGARVARAAAGHNAAACDPVRRGCSPATRRHARSVSNRSAADSSSLAWTATRIVVQHFCISQARSPPRSSQTSSASTSAQQRRGRRSPAGPGATTPAFGTRPNQRDDRDNAGQRPDESRFFREAGRIVALNPMFDGFSEPGRHVMARALSEAQALGHRQLGPEHVLLALCDGGDDPAASLRKVRLSAKRVHESIVAIVGSEEPLPASDTLPLSDRAREVVRWAVQLADAADFPEVTPAHLLLALTLDNDGTAIRILHQRSVDPYDLEWAILDRLAPDRQSDLSTGCHQAASRIRMDVAARSPRVGDPLEELCDLSDGLSETERRLLARLTDRYRVSRAVVDGDRASYSRLVRMVQPFATRYPLAEGRGNFGSIDHDPPADMQYTEARLTKLVADITSFPYLLANGGSGIPPHNLAEVIAATVAYLDDPTLDTTGLLAHLHGPDFRTAGTVINGNDLHEIYHTASGSIQIQGHIAVEPAERGTDLVITQLPFGARKGGDGGLIMQIVDLVHDKTLSGISDLTDQSNDLGMRLIISLRSEADPDAIIGTLLERTMLQLTVPVDMVALVDGTARRLSLHGLISEWVTARRRDHSDDDIRTQLQAVADRHSSTRLTAIT